MIQPRRIGRFLFADELGYVRPDVAVERIGEAWRPLVQFISRSLMARQGVRSVYIRGSIPRGLAIEDVSDADFIYVSEINFDAADLALEAAAQTAFPFVKGVELFRLDSAQFNKRHHPNQRPYFHMLVKTQSLFLAGDDLADDIAPFRIGVDMASHVFSLAKEFAQVPKLLEQSRETGEEQAMRQWFSRRIVRSGLEITMNRSSRFTRDLYLCYEQFARFYPERAEPMYQVLANCLNGEHSPVQYEEIVSFLTKESSGLLAR